MDKELIGLSSLLFIGAMVENISRQVLWSKKSEVGIVISFGLKGSSHHTRKATISSKNQYGIPKLVVAWGQIHRHRSTSMGCVSCAERGLSSILGTERIGGIRKKGER